MSGNGETRHPLVSMLTIALFVILFLFALLVVIAIPSDKQIKSFLKEDVPPWLHQGKYSMQCNDSLSKCVVLDTSSGKTTISIPGEVTE